MNAAVRAIEVDWRGPTAERDVLDPRSRRLVAQLAYALARPLGLLCDGTELATEISAASLKKMTGHPFFAAPVQRAVSRMQGFDAIDLGPDFVHRVANRPATRLSLLLLTEPIESLAAAAFDLAACVLQKRLMAVLLKGERAKLRVAFGPAMDLGLQQAPMLYPSLAELEREEGARAALAAPADETKARVGEIGLSGFLRAIEAAEPRLATVFARRCRAVPALTAPCSERHLDQVLKLSRRRSASWAAIIG
jgi:hypothetical protein